MGQMSNFKTAPISSNKNINDPGNHGRKANKCVLRLLFTPPPPPRGIKNGWVVV